MRLLTAALILGLLLCLCQSARSCEPEQMHDGCKIFGTDCTCGYGCPTEYIYRSRRACLNALRIRGSNYCQRKPCLRGICTQVAQGNGYACKCEGTGFYGARCERACPTIPMPGLLLPHECIVI